MRSREGHLTSIHAGLTRWVRGKMPSAGEVALSPLTKPSAGVSNETLLCDLSWREGGALRTQGLVVRLAPTDFPVFPEYDLPRQARVMRCLAGTDVPVPEVLWLEEDASILGCPFYVMKRIDGDIPSEVPLYHAFGLCFDATPERRANMWWSGIRTLARIHALDWRRRGLGFLGVPEGGTGPLDLQLDYYERFFVWAGRGEPHPILESALVWLKQNRFAPRRLTLCWGDSRLPNLIFRDDEVVGVLDWEMAFLGDPEADLAWWLFLDWHHSEGYGIPRLDGFPSREETVQRYEEISGHSVDNLLYQEVMAAFRFGVIMVSVANVLEAQGIQTANPELATNNPATQRLAALLDLPPPGGPRRQTTRIDETTVRVQFHLTGPGGHDWYVVSDRGVATSHEGTVENPDVTLTAAAADWDAIQKGVLDRTQAYLGGRLVIQGDMSLLMQLEETISRLSGGPA